jgi:alpha-L-fucosidase
MKIVSVFLVILFLASSCSETSNKTPAPTWETMKYGLFVHFVYGGEYGGMTPLGKGGGFPNNIDEFAESFDVEKFADDVKAMGFEYVIFTAWHANMGVLYPSKVMADYGFDQEDHYTSERDLLGEIIEALHKRDIQFSIYTHIFVGHDFHPEGSGYFKYDNKDGIITDDMVRSGYVESVNGNPEKWNDFVCAVYDEMSSRYGEKVCAYWFDGTWVNWVDKQRIMDTIRKTNKTGAMVANGTPDHGMPFSSKEVGSPEGLEYGFQSDYPIVKNNDVTTWPAYERNIALIQGGNWWASVSGSPKFSAETIYRFTVLEAGVNTGGGVSWSFSPFVDGTWEGNMLEIMTTVNGYLDPVSEAIKNTYPSQSFITKEGSKISTLENGFVATRSADGQYEYIHVLNKRTENFLLLPHSADGRLYDSAVLLPDNKKVDLHATHDGYAIILPDGEAWDPLNTVIKLGVSKRKSLKRVALEDLGIKTGVAPKLVASRIVDNGILIELEFDKSLQNVSEQVGSFSVLIDGEPVSITSVSHDFNTIKLGLAYPAREGNKLEAAFEDGELWSTDGGVLTRLDVFEVDNPLQNVEFHSVPGQIEAEDFILQNGVVVEGTEDDGGGKNLGYINPGDWMDYAIDVPETGRYIIEMRISGDTEGKVVFQTPALTLSKDLQTLTIPVTGGWQNWETISVGIQLEAGKQYLRIGVIEGGFNFNYFRVIEALNK